MPNFTEIKETLHTYVWTFETGFIRSTQVQYSCPSAILCIYVALKIIH